MRFVALLVTLAGLCELVSSQTIPTLADDTLLTTRIENGLKGIDKTELGVTWEPTKDGQVTSILTMGATFTQVWVVAKPANKAKELANLVAETLDAEKLPDLKVRYAEEGGNAIVTASSGQSYFGQSEATRTLPVGKIADVFRLHNWDATVVVRTGPYGEITPINLAKGTSTNWNVYGGKNIPTDASLKYEVTLSAPARIAFYFFLVGPWLVAILGLLSAYIYGKNERIPVERRRVIYPKLAMTPIYGTIAVHAPFAIWFIVGRGYRPFVDLWFGTYSAIVMMPFIVVPPPLLFLMVPFMNKLERKLFGDAVSEQAIPLPEISEEEKQLNKRIARWKLVPLALGLAVLLITFLMNTSTFYMVGLIIAFFGDKVVDWYFKKQKKSYELAEVDSDHEVMVRSMAMIMGTEVSKVKIDTTPLGRSVPNASANSKGEVTFTKRLLEILEPDELRAVAAHELAHLKLGHLKVRRRVVYIGVGAMLPFIFASSFRIFFGNSIVRMLLMSAPILMFPLLPLVIKPMMRKQEYEADRAELEFTRDLDASISGLTKMAQNSTMPHMHEVEVASSHPALSKRIEQFRAIAKELGITGKTATDNSG